MISSLIFLEMEKCTLKKKVSLFASLDYAPDKFKNVMFVRSIFKGMREEALLSRHPSRMALKKSSTERCRCRLSFQISIDQNQLDPNQPPPKTWFSNSLLQKPLNHHTFFNVMLAPSLHRVAKGCCRARSPLSESQLYSFARAYLAF